VALAAHFGTWMPSVQLGSVATSTALVATQPVWQGLIAAAQGRRPSAAGWIGIGLAVAGAAWATGVDVGVSGRAVLADVLALLGAVAAAVYTALGEQARASLSTTTYTWLCYGTCAAFLLMICLIGGVRLAGYDGRTVSPSSFGASTGWFPDARVRRPIGTATDSPNATGSRFVGAIGAIGGVHPLGGSALTGNDGARLPTVPARSPLRGRSYGCINPRPIGTNTRLNGSRVVSVYSGTPLKLPARTIRLPSKNRAAPARK